MKRLKKILLTIAFPLVMYLIMECACQIFKGRHLIGSILDIKTLVRNSGIAALTAFALSFNLNCGRFDLSLGAQRLAGTIVGGILAVSFGLSGVWILLFSLGFGLLFGFITGIVFVVLRVPPMVLGIGIGLIWECVPYVVSQGKGLNLFGTSGNGILTETSFTIILIGVAAFFVAAMMNATRFGYEMRAIQGSQLIARNSGINIFKHAVFCYALAGALVCVAGTVDAAFSTQMSATLGLASISAVTVHMFPMILGGYIGTWSNNAIGIIVAALTVRLFSSGLTTLEFSEPNANLANAVLFIVFLVFLANKDVFKRRKAEAKRIAQAHAKRCEIGG
jgi:ribose/xylose/arabinose/galactoside ABC-type transport system permease subunit